MPNAVLMMTTRVCRQRFEFDHARALMSCIAVNEMTGEAIVYSKGGFESVAHTCRPETGTCCLA